MIITIFVRHTPGCKYAGDEFHKSCNCRKHFRWSKGGKQFRKTAGTRSWSEAEANKRRMEDQFAGRAPVTDTPKTIADAVDSFLLSKKAQGVTPSTYAMVVRELDRLKAFTEGRGVHSVNALTLDVLIDFRDTWSAQYKSSYSQIVAQKRLKNFLRFCYDAGWLTRVPKLSGIKNVQPETQPLTADEYTRILAGATGKTHALIQLMRWSGLAVRDASTLKRVDLDLDPATGLYRVIRKRTKTGTDLYIPIPPDVAAELLAVANGNPVYIFWDARGGSPGSHARHSSEAVADVFKAAGIESAGHMVGHRLRSTFACDLLQKGVPLEHVSKLLGHKSVVTTEKSYARWVKGRQDRLDKLVSDTW
jgi:integrase/recombinase XerD